MIPKFGVVTLTKNSSNLSILLESLKRDPGIAAVIAVCSEGLSRYPEGPLYLGQSEQRTEFIFARNANRGLECGFENGWDYAILINDDAALFTPFGFSSMVAVAEQVGPQFGLLGPLIRGVVGNTGQREQELCGQQGIYPQPVLHFVSVLIPRWTWEKIGPLDERFTGYGYEDNDYCDRVRAAGHEVGVWSGTVVLHPAPGSVSTFRSGDWLPLYEQNRKIYEEKQAAALAAA